MLSVLTLTGAAPALLAYLDPGSGSMMFQVMVAGLLSGLVALSTARRALTEKFRQVFGKGAK